MFAVSSEFGAECAVYTMARAPGRIWGHRCVTSPPTSFVIASAVPPRAAETRISGPLLTHRHVNNVPVVTPRAAAVVRRISDGARRAAGEVEPLQFAVCEERDRVTIVREERIASSICTRYWGGDQLSQASGIELCCRPGLTDEHEQRAVRDNASDAPGAPTVVTIETSAPSSTRTCIVAVRGAGCQGFAHVSTTSNPAARTALVTQGTTDRARLRIDVGTPPDTV